LKSGDVYFILFLCHVSILLIDDDYELIDLLTILLEVEGYNVDAATNGLSGIEKLKKKFLSSYYS